MELYRRITREDYKFCFGYTYAEKDNQTIMFSHFYVRKNRESYQYCLVIAEFGEILTEEKIGEYTEIIMEIVKLENYFYSDEEAIKIFGKISRNKFLKKRPEKVAEMRGKLPEKLEYKTIMAKCYSKYHENQWQAKADICRNKEMNEIMKENRELLNNRPVFRNPYVSAYY